MRDGLSTENFLVGSVTANTLSGDTVNVGTAIATAEIENNAVTFAKLANNAVSGTAVSAGGIGTIAKIFAGVVDADTNTLSSGSRIVTFRQEFPAVPFVTATFLPNGRTANQARDGDWLSVGSITTTTALFLGSPGGYDFNWIAVGSR